MSLVTQPIVASPPPGPEANGATHSGATIAYHKVPHPFRQCDVLLYDAAATYAALEAASRGSPLSRLAAGPAEAPDEREVLNAERSLRRQLLGRSRVARGRSLWWWFAGPALALLWVNSAETVAVLFWWLPPVASLVGSLGAVSGGALLATLVALAPLLWAWRRAARHAQRARHWGRLARFIGRRRYRESPLHRAAEGRLAAFVEASTPIVTQLRAEFPRLPERGADGAGEAAQLARTLYRLAVRHGLAGPADVYHALYACFSAAEQSLTRLERTESGVFGERRAAAHARRISRQASAELAPYTLSGRVPAYVVAPAGGLLAGLAAIVGVLLVTGAFWVEPDQAVIVDPPPARLARLASALGTETAGGGLGSGGDTVEVVRSPGLHWDWPLPFSARHAVTLGEQRVRLRAVFRQTGPDSLDVVVVQLRFRITDVDRWALHDRTGGGVARLAAELSSVLQNGLQQQRSEARQALAQQNPSLADDQRQLAARADQLVETRLDDLVRSFVRAMSTAGATRDEGIQVTQSDGWRLLRGEPASVVVDSLSE